MAARRRGAGAVRARARPRPRPTRSSRSPWRRSGPARRLSAAPVAGAPAGRRLGAPALRRRRRRPGRCPGLFFRPTNRGGRTGHAEAPPPLVVFCHGGPTSSAEPGFDPVVQFFTSRGLAVAAVDYRGSSGYGRAYRESLRRRGAWPTSTTAWTTPGRSAEAGPGRRGPDGHPRHQRRRADRPRRPGAGRLFAGAAAWYGVTDLEALAADTHDFESRYLDSLVGPLARGRGRRYRDRSPIHHADG